MTKAETLAVAPGTAVYCTVNGAYKGWHVLTAVRPRDGYLRIAGYGAWCPPHNFRLTAPHYIVMCRVSGGVTGTREAPLKANGEVRTFGTRAEAEGVATHLMRELNGNPHRTADFRYWAVEA